MKTKNTNNSELKCDGSCYEHVGEVVKVEVYDSVFVYSYVFNYCESAIKEDQLRGFNVVIIK